MIMDILVPHEPWRKGVYKVGRWLIVGVNWRWVLRVGSLGDVTTAESKENIKPNSEQPGQRGVVHSGHLRSQWRAIDGLVIDGHQPNWTSLIYGHIKKIETGYEPKLRFSYVFRM